MAKAILNVSVELALAQRVADEVERRGITQSQVVSEALRAFFEVDEDGDQL